MVIRELHPDLAKKAKSELNEDPERIQKDLATIREWIDKQPHLNVRTDDQWLIGFLRGCKYSLERTKEKLDMYYTMRTAIPEIFQAPDPMESWAQEILSSGTYIPLPKTANPDDPRVFVIRPGAYDPNKISTMQALRVNQLYTTLLHLEDDQSIIAGQRYILDLENISMAHITQMTPSLIKKMVASSQDALPIRQKGTHHINTPAIADTILKVMNRFMNEKNRNRIFLHNKDMEDLYKHIPKDILPTEYGGNAGSLQSMIDYWKKRIEGNREWYLEDMKFKSDESKRPGEPKTSEALFGIEGSFRQLNID